MKHQFKTLLVAAGLLCLLAGPSLASGGPSRTRAVAAVAVAQAVVRIASETPQLPDTSRPTRTLNPREVQDAPDGRDATRVVPMQFRPVLEQPQRPDNPLATSSRLKATIFTGEAEYGTHWCPNCRVLKREWGDGDARLELDWSTAKANGPQLYPAVRFVDHHGQERFPANTDGDYRAITRLDELVELLRRHQNSIPQNQVAASGFGGSIRARTQVRQALAWFRESVGENVALELQWHRTGGQSFPLLANGDWSAAALFGTYGHVKLAAAGLTRLPISSSGFSYQIVGNDVTIDLDAMTIPGLALQLGPSSFHPGPLKHSEAAPAPSGVELMTVWTVVSVVRDLWSLLHPSCDLQLGGSVIAKAELVNDALTIEFDQMPSLRIVALFTFQLGVQRVVIKETNIHVDFSGSRFIKSRDFQVE